MHRDPSPSHCLAIPTLCMSTDHQVKRGKDTHAKWPPGVQWKKYIQDDRISPSGREKVEGEGNKASLIGSRMWSLQVNGCGKGATGESTCHPCPRSLDPQMVVWKLNLNETLRPFLIDVYDLVNGALNCYSFPNQPLHLKFQQLRSFYEASPPSAWELSCGLLNNSRDAPAQSGIVDNPLPYRQEEHCVVLLFPHLPLFILPEVAQHGHLQQRGVEAPREMPKSNRQTPLPQDTG